MLCRTEVSSDCHRDRNTNLLAARLHALNGISIFEQDPAANGDLLKSAIDEFGDIIGKTEGSNRLENIFVTLRGSNR